MTIALAARPTRPAAEKTSARRVFQTWSIDVPVDFAETFVDQDAYWHAYGPDRSISLTSMLVEGREGPVSAESILAVLPASEGNALDAVPPQLAGWAVTSDAIPPARAQRCLSGVLAVDGRILLVTITSDDADWARRCWLSIRHYAVAPKNRR